MPLLNYRIDPRPTELGGGWKLLLIEDEIEVGGGVFQPVGDQEDAEQIAYDAALTEASLWLATRGQNEGLTENN